MRGDSWDDLGAGHPPKPPRSFPPDRRPEWHVFPQTLDDLLRRAGPYADATRIHVEWAAITVWMMKEGYEVLSAIPKLDGRAASLSVCLVREAAELGAGWPHHEGKIITPAIYGYSTDCQCEARRIANEVRTLWEAAGRPYLRPDDYKFAFQHLVACIRNGVIPQQRTIGDVPPNDIQ